MGLESLGTVLRTHWLIRATATPWGCRRPLLNVASTAVCRAGSSSERGRRAVARNSDYSGYRELPQRRTYSGLGHEGVPCWIRFLVVRQSMY